ncbi:ATP-binding cassette domain-containing protein [Flavihumibacter sp. CACIAM 22H1]|uniref:ATP-binding cassette domain-containing protein n=1 Tax=Flavihumibacter sp. CACIAM 22H1 TaxID=1812911 RepID=UPI0025BE84B5|nr:ATP-binding cassette domain-containing protein [Flavihumibacter sp. CACIAM 22H1]
MAVIMIFFEQQKQLERQAMEQAIGAAEKALRQAREIERETKERQQKLNSRGKDKQEKAGIAKIMMNSLRNSAERTSAKLKEVHTEKMQGLKEELLQRRAAKPAILSMKFDWEESGLHQGKRLFSATAMNYEYHPGQPVWKNPLNWQVNSGERWALKGNNGTGKTTLLKLLLGQLKASGGIVYRADFKAIYLDQDYSLINSKQTVFERACEFNKQGLEDHHIKNRLHRFLFEKADWEITCSSLSGGERMRLLLCCLHISQQAPDLIVLDEPTNNLDLDNLEILANAIRQYKGSLLVVSHDSRFLEDIQVTRELVLR